MGNTLSSIFNKSYVQYEITEDVVAHPLVGQFLVLRDVITENFVFGIEVNMEELEIQDYAELERHQLFAHANILRFEGFKKLDDQNYLTLFESYEYTLEEEIQARIEQNKRFTENEVLGLLQNIGAALAYFQKKGVYHGQVTAENIVKKGDDYKLIDPVIFENYETTYGRILQGEDDSQVRLLSPELLKALENNDEDPEYEEYKQDIYALGVIILDSIVLDTAIPLPRKFQLAADYSKSLMQILNQMVEVNPFERIDAVSCSKVIENIYYGFPMSEEADPSPVPAEVTNQVKSVLPGYYDVEISPGKADSSSQRASASGKKSKRTPFHQFMDKMNGRSSSAFSAQLPEGDFSNYLSIDHRAKSNPGFSIHPQSLSQSQSQSQSRSQSQSVAHDDPYGLPKANVQSHSISEPIKPKKIQNISESYSDHVSYKYTATNQSQDAVPSSFISKDTSQNKTLASHLNTQSVDFHYTGASRSNTLSQEPKKDDLNYTASDDFSHLTQKGPAETFDQANKNPGSKALFGILGDTYSSKLHTRTYSNPIELSARKIDADSSARHGHEAKSIAVNSRDFMSEIASNKDAISPKAQVGSISYHHSRQSSQQQHGTSHQRSDSNIFSTQPKILVESYYLHGEGSPEHSPQKYQSIVGNIVPVSESASPEKASERMTSNQKESIQLASLDQNTPASKRNFQTFRAQGGSDIPLETVVSIPISPNQEYERLMSLYLPDRTPHNLEELARSIQSLNTTTNAQAVKPFSAVLEETHQVDTSHDIHHDHLRATETSQPLTYTASVDYPTEMSHASPGSPPKHSDAPAYQSNIAYQTFNPKVWNPQLRTDSLSNQSPSPKKLHEPILRNTGQTGDYVPSFNSYRAHMDIHNPSSHTNAHDRYDTLRYQDKSSLQTIVENVSTQGFLDTYATNAQSAQKTNPAEYASNKTDQLFTTSPDNMKYRDYLTGSIDFPSKGLSTINVQTSYQATEYIPRNTVESLSPGDAYKGYLYTDYNTYGSPAQHYGESSVKTDPRDSAHPLDIASASKQSQLYKYSVGDLDDHYDSIGTVVNMGSVDHDPHSLKEAEMNLRAMEWQKTRNALTRSRAKLRQSVIEEDDSFIDKRFEQIEMLISTVDKLSHKRVMYPPRTTERDINKLKDMARKSISISTSVSTRYHENGSRHRLSLFDGRTTLNGLYNTPEN